MPDIAALAPALDRFVAAIGSGIGEEVLPQLVKSMSTGSRRAHQTIV
jgi:hypothetical protein